MTPATLDQMDEETRISELMEILRQVDRIVSDAEGEWTFDAIDGKEDLQSMLVKLFGVDADRVQELVDEGDADLP
jgi:hypothetical protein